MGTRERILIIRLMEKARANPGCTKALGITVAEANRLARMKGT